MAGFGNYIAWQALKENEKFTWIRSLALTFASIGGTCFQESDLTNANFTLSLLKSTNFRGANLTRTYWFNAQKLNLSIVGESYLKNLQLRQLLVTGQGQDKNFDRFDLRGVNLQGANLVDASFIGADLSGANLQSSNLSRAKLVQTQLDRTDFTGATLTGAYIEDWGITSDTKFDEVRCEYVFMRLPTEENPNPWRKPDNWEEKFKDGDFAIFIKPIFATLDLYHTQNINFQAIAIALEQLSKKHPEAELEIVAMEKRGQDNFLVRAKTHPSADLSKLSAEYFSDYNQLKSLPQEALIFIITEQKNEIRMLAGRPSIYAETFQQQGDIVSEKSENSTYNLNHAKFGGGFAGDGGTQIGGTFNDYSTAPTAQPNSTVKTILILAANPRTTSPLRLNEEVREIDSGLQRAKKRDQFELKQKWAVRIQDVYQSLLDFKPQFVHFCGHGTGEDGLVLEDDNGEVRLVDTAALAELFKLFSSSIECVVFNACYSEVQAQAVVQHIPYVIGMKKEIGDFAAIKFATGFYNAVGSGESVEFAYKLGCNVIQLEGVPEHLTPQLKKRG